MWLDGVWLLAAPGSRSQAYLQALAKHDLLPERVLALGDGARQASPSGAPPPPWHGLHLPDLGESIAATCERAGVALEASSAVSVNDASVVARLVAARPALVVYSGYGGQIVSEDVLRCGPRFLHLHSGWLPEYRGSTTIYYALLRNESPGVTAIVLDRTIDTGPIVAQRRYPMPPAGMDIDRVYDAAIRADLLVRVMQEYVVHGDLPLAERQAPDEGRTYYVIHPVLKHLALLSLAGDLP